jgi:hypothetical protein
MCNDCSNSLQYERNELNQSYTLQNNHLSIHVNQSCVHRSFSNGFRRVACLHRCAMRMEGPVASTVASSVGSPVGSAVATTSAEQEKVAEAAAKVAAAIVEEEDDD